MHSGSVVFTCNLALFGFLGIINSINFNQNNHSVIPFVLNQMNNTLITFCWHLTILYFRLSVKTTYCPAMNCLGTNWLFLRNLGLIWTNEKSVARFMSEHGVYYFLAMFDKNNLFKGRTKYFGAKKLFFMIFSKMQLLG